MDVDAGPAPLPDNGGEAIFQLNQRLHQLQINLQNMQPPHLHLPQPQQGPQSKSDPVSGSTSRSTVEKAPTRNKTMRAGNSRPDLSQGYVFNENLMRAILAQFKGRAALMIRSLGENIAAVADLDVFLARIRQIFGPPANQAKARSAFLRRTQQKKETLIAYGRYNQ